MPLLWTQAPALILTMGIVGVGLGLMALPMAFGGTATRLVGLAASVLALPIAIGAWSMAKTDWRRILSGRVDPNGLIGTQAGWACGLGGALLCSISLVAALVWGITNLIGAARNLNSQLQAPNEKATSISEKPGKMTEDLVKKPAQEGAWIDASKGPAKIGKFQVEVAHWRIGKLMREGKSGGVNVQLTTYEDQYIISFKITNATSNEVLHFQGLSRIQGISLTDNFGKSAISMVRMGQFEGVISDEEFESGELQPGETVSDALSLGYRRQGAVSPPVQIRDFLRLEIPGKAFGAQENLRLQIPKSLLRETN